MHPSFESDASRGLCASRDHLEDAQSSAGGAAEAPEPIRAQERATTFQKKTHKTQRPLNSFPFFHPFLARCNCTTLHSSVHLCGPHPTLRHSRTSLQPHKTFSFLATQLLCGARRLPGPTGAFSHSPLSSLCGLQPHPACSFCCGTL